MGFGKDGKGAIIRERITLTAGNLAAAGVVKHTSGLTLGEDFRILKIKYHLTLQGNFGALGDQVIVGFANGELSTSEISNCINTDGPNDSNDRLNTEQAERAAWLWHQIVGSSTTVPNAALEDGRVLEQTPRWTFSNPEGWAWFLYNPLGGALTSGLVISVNATYYGVWVK